ncbi:FG-GAP-like repeat-containing protein [Glycomyces sp. NPDC049804]|uniref:FG-GAP repeat domain-containing protein n=1 Tax=Glycomyces sp. NPDC049804 TaxID=3154363 RepID=UPI00343B94B8
MSPDSPRARRAGLRLLAAAAAGCTAAAAFATPAAAAIPGIYGDPVATLQLAPDLDNTEMAASSMTVDYTYEIDGDTTTHAVVTELVFDDPYGVLDITTADPACDVSAPATIVCSADSGSHTEFLFEVTPAASAEDDAIDYTFTATVDGFDVAGSTGAFGVVSDYDVHNPYAHGDFVQTGVVEGDDILVKPVFYQAFDLAPTTEAVVLTFANPVAGEGLDTTGLATVRDLYNNCRATSDATGIECVITDFSDAQGQFLTITNGVAYKIAEDVVGPLDVCGCQYSVETINAATLAEEYDNLSWVSGSGTAVGLTTAPEGWDGAEESKALYWGGVTLTTGENKYDLAVEEITLKGNLNTNAKVTTTVSNNGSAAADDLDPAGQSYLVRAQLPQGTELVRVESAGGNVWDCYGADELDAVYESTPDTALERFDFACTTDSLEPGESVDFIFTVKLTDTTAFQGAIEIGAVFGDEYEGDFYNDFALIYNEAVEARYDYNRDGYEDLFVVRKSDGALRFYAGNSTGAYKAGVTVGTGWGAYDIIMAGDLTGDDVPDFLARDTRNGTLYTYPGNGSGGHGTRISNGTGWGTMGQIAVGHYDGDGNPDILATAFADGGMYFYEGLGNGKFGARELWGEQWDGYDVITSLGDLDFDGFDEFLSRWNTTGVYYISTSQGQVFEFAQDLDTYPYSSLRYEQVIGAGDLGRDGKGDIAAVDIRTGQLVVRSFDPAQGGYISGSKVIGSSGWNTVRLPVVNLDRTYDYDGDGYSDFIAQRKSDGDIRLYYGTGKGHGTPWTFCEDCDGVTALAAGGDYTADGRLDVLYRFNGGLYTIHGIDDGVHYGFDGADVYAGSGWNSMSDISGGHDYTSDGKDDLVARHTSTGTLYVYPGRGDGTFGTKIKVGTGWGGMRETNAVGDLDHDGHADLLSIAKSDSCLYFYRGNGNGTFKSRVQVSCGWKSYEAITGVGDFNRDGHADFLSRRVTDGVLFLYPGNGKGGHGTRVQIGTGWNAMNIG